MNYEALTQNLIGMVKESQIKLGYTKTPIHLYFPAQAICHLLDTQASPAQLEQILADFSQSVRDVLGTLTISVKDEMFCITVPEKGVEYVHNNVETSGFLEEFIACMSKPERTMEDITAVFRKYSDQVVVQTPNSNTDEFDYLIYFADGKPDAYRYCIHDEMGQLIYHRFTQKEFETFGF